MKKTLIIISGILIGAAVVFSCNKDKSIMQNNLDNSKDSAIKIYSACYLWLENISGIDTCVNYHFDNELNPVLCGLVFPFNWEECDPAIIVGPKYIHNDNGGGYDLLSLTIYNYEQLAPDQKVLFDKLLRNGEVTIMNGITINNAEMLAILDNDFIEGGTFPIELVDGKPVITLK